MKVYKYGCLPPTLNSNLVSDQMLKAYRYNNDLISIANTEKIIIQELEREFLNKISDAEEKLNLIQNNVDALFLEKNAKRIETKSKIDSQEIKQKIKAEKAKLKIAKTEYYAQLKNIRTNEELIVQKEKIWKIGSDLVKNARKYCNVY